MSARTHAIDPARLAGILRDSMVRRGLAVLIHGDPTVSETLMVARACGWRSDELLEAIGWDWSDLLARHDVDPDEDPDDDEPAP